MKHTRVVFLAAGLFAAPGCDESPTEATGQRVLGLVAAPANGLAFPGIEANPRAWIVQGRHVQVEITTEGFCHVVRPDWHVTISDGHTENPGLLFILPYEVRSTSCTGSNSATREGHPRTLFTDTLDVSFSTALEAVVRIVSADGQVFDRELDFHPGWPPGGG